MPCLWFKAANGIIRKIVEARISLKRKLLHISRMKPIGKCVYGWEIGLLRRESIFKLTQFFAFILTFVIGKASYIVQKIISGRRIIKIRVTIKVFCGIERPNGGGQQKVRKCLSNWVNKKQNRNEIAEILYYFLHYNQSDYFLRSPFHTCSLIVVGQRKKQGHQHLVNHVASAVCFRANFIWIVFWLWSIKLRFDLCGMPK